MEHIKTIFQLNSSCEATRSLIKALISNITETESDVSEELIAFLYATGNIMQLLRQMKASSKTLSIGFPQPQNESRQEESKDTTKPRGAPIWSAIVNLLPEVPEEVLSWVIKSPRSFCDVTLEALRETAPEVQQLYAKIAVKHLVYDTDLDGTLLGTFADVAGKSPGIMYRLSELEASSPLSADALSKLLTFLSQ